MYLDLQSNHQYRGISLLLNRVFSLKLSCMKCTESGSLSNSNSAQRILFRNIGGGKKEYLRRYQCSLKNNDFSKDKSLILKNGIVLVRSRLYTYLIFQCTICRLNYILVKIDQLTGFTLAGSISRLIEITDWAIARVIIENS